MGEFEKKFEWILFFAERDIKSFFGMSDKKLSPFSPVIRRIFEEVYKCDNRIDESPLDDINEHPFKSALNDFEQDLKKYLKEKIGYETEKYFRRLRILWVADVKLRHLLKTGELGKKEAKRMITNVLRFKGGDYELCFDAARHYFKFRDELSDKTALFYHKIWQIRDIRHEVHDFERDSKSGEYNTLIVMKKVGIPLKFISDVLNNRMSEVESFSKELQKDIKIAGKSSKVKSYAVMMMENETRTMKEDCDRELKKIFKD